MSKLQFNWSLGTDLTQFQKGPEEPVSSAVGEQRCGEK